MNSINIKADELSLRVIMKKLVVLTGAGVSAESGLRTFRDGDGLWEGHDVTKVATPEAWHTDPRLVLDFYNMRRRDVAAAKPNPGHLALAAMEKDFDVTIITQNIDDLHERAGSRKVIHLHGEIFRMRSDADTETTYEIREDMEYGALAPDGSLLRPAIVWFGEAVPMIEKAIATVMEADIFVVAGTSLLVYPAAGLLHYVADSVPKFIVDRRLPNVSGIRGLTALEEPSGTGLPRLHQMLLALK
ncbi:MAG: SIR2 family NAD-dependent protein deacylase [Chitinophagaceae bacterium]